MEELLRIFWRDSRATHSRGFLRNFKRNSELLSGGVADKLLDEFPGIFCVTRGNISEELLGKAWKSLREILKRFMHSFVPYRKNIAGGFFDNLLKYVFMEVLEEVFG